MAKPNYNLIRFIRRNIYRLKRDYGGQITFYKLGSVDTDYETGIKTEAHTSYVVDRAVVLPVRIKREAVQSISLISANKKVVQGGTYDAGTRTFIIDRRDLKVDSISNDDWLVYNGRRYELKWIDEFEQNTAWLIWGKEVEGRDPIEDRYGTSSHLLSFTDTVGSSIGVWRTASAVSSLTFTDTISGDTSDTFNESVSSSVSFSDALSSSVVGDKPASASNDLGVSDSSTGTKPLPLLRTNGGTADGTFDPVITTSGGTILWDLGDGSTSTTASVSHTYAASGNYAVKLTLTGGDLISLNTYKDGVTEFNIPSDYTSFNHLSGAVNELTSFDGEDWASDFNYLNLGFNANLTSVTVKDWPDLDSFSVSDCDISSLTTKNTWTKLTVFNVGGNSSLSSITLYSTWALISSVYMKDCDFSASVIDDALIALDATGAANGTLDYSGNPGSADSSRSSAATTAKNNLVSNGWTITI